MLNIHERYETNEVAEVEGVWVELEEGASIKVARWNNTKHSEAADKLKKPYKAYTRNGLDIPEPHATNIMIESMVEAILLDWKGIAGPDGKELPYSKDAARKLLAIKDFRGKVAVFSAEQSTFRKSELEEIAKNLEATSPGKTDGDKTKRG